jgi:hypothetical protein
MGHSPRYEKRWWRKHSYLFIHKRSLGQFTSSTVADAHVPEHLYSEASGMRSDKETSVEAVTPHDANAPSKMYPAAVRPRIKRVPWTPEEDATVLKMRDEVLPHRTPGAIQAQYYAIRAGVGEADVSGGQQQKRRRGRPRKQV